MILERVECLLGGVHHIAELDAPAAAWCVIDSSSLSHGMKKLATMRAARWMCMFANPARFYFLYAVYMCRALSGMAVARQKKKLADRAGKTEQAIDQCTLARPVVAHV